MGCSARGRVDADDLGVGFGVDGARETVERVASDAGAVGGGGAVRVLVELDAERKVEGVQPLAAEHVAELLDAGFVDDWRVGVGSAGPGLGRVFAALAVDVIEGLGLGVERLELIVTDGPGRRKAVFVLEFAEVALAQAEQGGAVDFRVAADIVVQAGVERLAGAAEPGLLRLIGAVDEDGLGVPVGAGARQVVAALEHQDALAGRGEIVGEGGATGPAADDDDVVMVIWHRCVPFRGQRPGGTPVS